MITPADILAASILIVDDKEANLLLLERMLRGAGYSSVTQASDPRTVCGLHRLHRYDLIVLDLQMPEMDGFQVMGALKEIEVGAYLPVLVITAQPAHKLHALKAGARDFISKPFDLAEVLMRVQNLIEVRLLHNELVKSGQQLRLRNQVICETFGRYLAEDVMESLATSPGALDLGGETRRVTMIMGDLRGFTAISESLTPKRVALLVNNYLEAMIEIVVQAGGTIDGFTGDGFLGLFGAPTARVDDAERAVACSLAMQAAMAKVNARNQGMGLPRVEMGIGLNTGEVVVGNIGSLQRAKYGAMGSAVNLTSRIESYASGGEIMMSQSTLDAVGDYAEVEAAQHVAPKGLSSSIPIYSVAGIHGHPEFARARTEARLTAPSAALGVQFSILQGKDVSGEVVVGEVVRVSRERAEIRAPGTAQAFDNLRLRFFDGGDVFPGDVYAKVCAGETAAGLFLVRFTSLPPQVEAFLEARREVATD